MNSLSVTFAPSLIRYGFGVFTSPKQSLHIEQAIDDMKKGTVSRKINHPTL
jgi:hypothetical protein